jgi:hypothetical protein
MVTAFKITHTRQLTLIATALFIYAASFSQKKPIYPDSLTIYKKADDLQFANYTPKSGKKGKDVSQLAELITMGGLSRNGKDGRDGANLTIRVSAVQLFEQKYLQLRILDSATSLTDTLYVNPYKGQVKIIADGSDGGREGTSDKGHKGEQGRAGKGGNIEIILDSSAAAFIRCRCLLFSNKDGAGSNVDKYTTDEILLANGQLLRPYDKPVKWTVQE